MSLLETMTYPPKTISYTNNRIYNQLINQVDEHLVLWDKLVIYLKNVFLEIKEQYILKGYPNDYVIFQSREGLCVIKERGQYLDGEYLERIKIEFDSEEMRVLLINFTTKPIHVYCLDHFDKAKQYLQSANIYKCLIYLPPHVATRNHNP